MIRPAIRSAKLWMRGGSSDDPTGERGAAQLLAGVLSRGCGSFSGDDLADLVEGLGAGLRCEASEDGTLISLKCASDDAPRLLPLLLQLVQRPWLVEDQIDLERQLNLQTLQRQKEDPFQLAHDQLRQQLYGLGPYGHDPLGVEADLQQLGREALVRQLQQAPLTGEVLQRSQRQERLRQPARAASRQSCHSGSSTAHSRFAQPPRTEPEQDV